MKKIIFLAGLLTGCENEVTIRGYKGQDVTVKLSAPSPTLIVVPMPVVVRVSPSIYAEKP